MEKKLIRGDVRKDATTCLSVTTMSHATTRAMHVRTLTLALLSWLVTTVGAQDRYYDMDRYATCGKDIYVFDDYDVVLNGRSDAAPDNPPLECIVYLSSGYTEADGNYRLQIIIDSIDIKDCKVHVDVFNGRGAYGSYLRSLGCNSKSTDTLYSDNREVTVRFSRPDILYQTGYTFTFKIRTYRDRDDGGYFFGTNRLSPGAIIGIVIGIVALIVVAALLGWCFLTGRLGGYYRGKSDDDNYLDNDGKASSVGVINNVATMEKSGSVASAIDHNDPGVWTSVTNGAYAPGNPKKLGRNFYQQRNASNRYNNNNARNVESGNYDDAYEPYERDTNVGITYAKNGSTVEWRKDNNGGGLNRDDMKRASTGSRGFGGDGSLKRDDGTRDSRGSRRSTGSKRASYAETEHLTQGADGVDEETDVKDKLLEDELGRGEFARDAPGVRSSNRSSTRGSKRGRQTLPPGADSEITMTVQEATVTTPNSAPPSSPKGDNSRNKHFFPDDDDDDENTGMKRYSSMDLQSEPDTESMSNPVHVNAAVRASIPDKASPSAKKRKKKPGKGGNSRNAASDEPLPEASDPIFTTPVSETPYDPSASLPYNAYGMPNYDPNMYGTQPYMPYGMPMGGFVPMPGQTYAYYQMGPTGGVPPGAAAGGPEQPVMAGQAAWYVQDTPQGPVKKGFMVTTSHAPSPKRKHRRNDGSEGPGGPGYTSTPADALTPHRGRKDRSHPPGDPMDISVIAATGAPPDPGPGQRSAVMRSGVDPHTGMQTNQVVWRDTIVDPTDPPPDANPQITRKTLTRITTRSGHGDLPTDQNPMTYNDYSDRLGIEDEDPGFLSPSRPATHRPAIAAATTTPDRDNVNFYLGQGRHPGAPEPVIHEPSTRNRAFRDKITMDDSSFA